MTNSIGSLLQARNISEPPEIQIIKAFVFEKIGVLPRVSLSEREIAIAVASASMAGALRPFLWEITQRCQTTKRLVIRIDPTLPTEKN